MILSQGRRIVALPEDPSLVPSAHIRCGSGGHLYLHHLLVSGNHRDLCNMGTGDLKPKSSSLTRQLQWGRKGDIWGWVCFAE